MPTLQNKQKEYWISLVTESKWVICQVESRWQSGCLVEWVLRAQHSGSSVPRDPSSYPVCHPTTYDIHFDVMMTPSLIHFLHIKKRKRWRRRQPLFLFWIHDRDVVCPTSYKATCSCQRNCKTCFLLEAPRVGKRLCALELYLQSNKERANAGRQLKVKEGTWEALVYICFTVSPFARRFGQIFLSVEMFPLNSEASPLLWSWWYVSSFSDMVRAWAWSLSADQTRADLCTSTLHTLQKVFMTFSSESFINMLSF